MGGGRLKLNHFIRKEREVCLFGSAKNVFSSIQYIQPRGSDRMGSCSEIL